jgi:DNA-binding NarL/FixJ family response regulator
MTTQPSQPLIEPLTQREIEVMFYYSNPFLDKKEIANLLSISMHTLNHHINNIFSKLCETERFAASWKFWEAYPEYLSQIREAILKSA